MTGRRVTLGSACGAPTHLETGPFAGDAAWLTGDGAWRRRVVVTGAGARSFRECGVVGVDGADAMVAGPGEAGADAQVVADGVGGVPVPKTA